MLAHVGLYSSLSELADWEIIDMLILSSLHGLGYPKYQDRIPNGHVNGQSTGHAGGSSAFRLAFMDAGYQWTRELCLADQDGDGQSNGLELGDPCCMWSQGAIPAFTTNISIGKEFNAFNFHHLKSLIND